MAATELIQYIKKGTIINFYLMPRRKLDQRNIRKLTKSGAGKSIGLTLPIEYVRLLGWRERQKVVVSKRGGKLIIEDWKK